MKNICGMNLGTRAVDAILKFSLSWPKNNSLPQLGLVAPSLSLRRLSQLRVSLRQVRMLDSHKSLPSVMISHITSSVTHQLLRLFIRIHSLIQLFFSSVGMPIQFIEINNMADINIKININISVAIGQLAMFMKFQSFLFFPYENMIVQ